MPIPSTVTRPISFVIALANGLRMTHSPFEDSSSLPICMSSVCSRFLATSLQSENGLQWPLTHRHSIARSPSLYFSKILNRSLLKYCIHIRFTLRSSMGTIQFRFYWTGKSSRLRVVRKLLWLS